MYLKEIEMLGFKSFADKTNITLDNQITCIVGPNGSGKSNIVDAVRFVLGEQSVKSLRGDNLMADVIFGGSKNRNSLNVASVTLTFDNSDNYLKIPYNNISIKRRLYKTGDNEYFINGEKCRLKEIIDLFLDSGIGRDSFNIISQGEISRILSNSAYDRRLVIEEAAGILKYKKRRGEAFKKLDKTNLNLERINDIITEIENRVIPLKKQSEKALEYLNYKKKLENVEVGLLVSEISSINIDYQEYKNKLKYLQDEIIILNKKINDPEINSLKLKEINLEKEIEKLNIKLLDVTKEKEVLNSRRLIYKERQKHDYSDIKTYDIINNLKDNKLKLLKDINILDIDINNILQEKKSIENKLNIFIDELNLLTEKRENLSKEYNYKNKEYYTISNKIDIVNNNLESNSYLNNNTRKVLDNPKLTGIHDAFLNIINTTFEYEKCLSVATITTKNFIIVDDTQSAKDAIKYLKDNNLGRLTFLPLDIIKPKQIDLETKNILNQEKGFLGVLSDYVTYLPKYQNIVLNQLGNIIVCETIDDATILSKKINNKYRIITKNGDVINIGGSITGGSLNNINSISSIKKELDNLKLNLGLIKGILSNLENELSNLELEFNQKNKIIYDTRATLIETINNLKNLKENLETKNKKLLEIDDELKSINNKDNLKEQDELDNLFYNKSIEYESLLKEINNKTKEKDQIKDNIIEKEGFIKVNSNELHLKEKEINKLEILLNKMDFKLDNNLNILNSEYNMTYERASLEYILDISIDDAYEKVLKYKSKLKDIGMVNLDSIKEYEEVNERYSFLNTERDDLLNAKKMLYSIIDEMDDVMQEEFLNTFKELEIEFKRVFKEMFNGGDASLKLTDPNNILETGVEIVACPPGKKLKTITLLSGGEKTLTAISLLFAILNVRSVPFCLFDEIEAALDEANVDNFSRYLNTYHNKTQFLLITHKKRTMEYAKTLYGVTMQESGVSKLVSVKLEDALIE